MPVARYIKFFDYMIPKPFVSVNVKVSSELRGEAIIG